LGVKWQGLVVLVGVTALVACGGSGNGDSVATKRRSVTPVATTVAAVPPTTATSALTAPPAEPRPAAGAPNGGRAVAAPPPLLVLQGTNDTVNRWTLSQRLYDGAASPKWLVVIDGADHLTPYTTGPQRGAIVALVAQFLRAQLQDPRRAGEVVAAANTGGLSLVATG
jgi:alpha-beta hydrolase superfamily lysophospholipase